MQPWLLRSVWLLTCFFGIPVSAYELVDHPRIFVRQANLGELASRASTVLSREYSIGQNRLVSPV